MIKPPATPAMYQVICYGQDYGIEGVPNPPGCGVVPLDEAEYLRQLDRPNRGWICPRCGGSADWDDDSLITSE